MMEHLTANPRFYDRLLAVCTIIIGGALVFLAAQALQPPLGPSTAQNNETHVEVRGVAQEASEPVVAEEVAGEYPAREPAS